MRVGAAGHGELFELVLTRSLHADDERSNPGVREMVRDDRREIGIVPLAIGGITVRDEHADHFASHRLVIDRVARDAPKRALDAGPVSTAEVFVADPLDERASRSHG